MYLSNGQVKEIFNAIDLDGNGVVDKDEMALFLNLILVQQETSHQSNTLHILIH